MAETAILRKKKTEDFVESRERCKFADVIVEGKICVCDVCGHRSVLEEGKPLHVRCKSSKCRSQRWNTGGLDRRTWKRVEPGDKDEGRGTRD